MHVLDGFLERRVGGWETEIFKNKFILHVLQC